MLEWCSISVITISSPGPSRNRSGPEPPALALPIEYATRLIPSEMFLVKTTSVSSAAPMNRAALIRAPS